MKWIKAEGVDFKYIFPDDNIMDEVLFTSREIIDGVAFPLLRGKDLSFDLYDTLQNGDNTRLAVFKIVASFPKTKGGNILLHDAPYCIIWPENDVNLTELDQKVRSDTFGDEDFNDSVKAYIKKVFCRNCHEEYIAIVVDPTDFYFVLDQNGKLDVSKFNLIKNKMNKFNFKKCPNCNSPFTIYVAKILYKCEDKKYL